MTSYREILRLHSLGLNKTEIASSCQCARNTVAATLQRAANCGLQWPLPEEMSDKQLSERLFPSSTSKPVYKMPDYASVHKELQRSGVTLNLLWLEYCDQCRAAGEIPYQSTQFNKYYADYLAKVNANGTIRKFMALYRKYALLIIDEWLLYPLKETETRDLLEIVESRYKRNSTIFCSQFDIPGWPEKLSDPLLADAICDRIIHDAYTIVIGGKESMRKRKGLQDVWCLDSDHIYDTLTALCCPYST